MHLPGGSQEHKLVWGSGRPTQDKGITTETWTAGSVSREPKVEEWRSWQARTQPVLTVTQARTG